MTFNRLNRRLHLYLALVLLPWVVMYALSSLVFSHERLISRLTGGVDEWTLRFEKPYDVDLALDADEAARRAFARRVVNDHRLDCERPPARLFLRRQPDSGWSDQRVVFHLLQNDAARV
jgi:hypothetical protein